MNTLAVTSIGLLVVTAVLVVWDVYVASNDVKGDTISEIVLKHSLKRPIIPFTIGVLCGHLFWPQ